MNQRKYDITFFDANYDFEKF